MQRKLKANIGLVQKYLGGEARARMASRLGITETQVTSLGVVLILMPIR